MATIKKAQSGAKTTKKPKTVSQRIGDITLRDVKNAGEDALNISTLGGYSKVKKALGGEYKYKKIGEKKNGGPVKAKNGTSLGMKSVKAGYDKNPSVTRADIITAAKGKAKSGTKMKKAQGGMNMLLPGVSAPKSRDEKYNSYPTIKTKPKPKPKSTLKEATKQEIEKYGMMGTRSMKMGGAMKKCKTGCK